MKSRTPVENQAEEHLERFKDMMDGNIRLSDHQLLIFIEQGDELLRKMRALNMDDKFTEYLEKFHLANEDLKDVMTFMELDRRAKDHLRQLNNMVEEKAILSASEMEKLTNKGESILTKMSKLDMDRANLAIPVHMLKFQVAYDGLEDVSAENRQDFLDLSNRVIEKLRVLENGEGSKTYKAFLNTLIEDIQAISDRHKDYDTTPNSTSLIQLNYKLNDARVKINHDWLKKMTPLENALFEIDNDIKKSHVYIKCSAEDKKEIAQLNKDDFKVKLKDKSGIKNRAKGIAKIVGNTFNPRR